MVKKKFVRSPNSKGNLGLFDCSYHPIRLIFELNVKPNKAHDLDLMSLHASYLEKSGHRVSVKIDRTPIWILQEFVETDNSLAH